MSKMSIPIPDKSVPKLIDVAKLRRDVERRVRQCIKNGEPVAPEPPAKETEDEYKKRLARENWEKSSEREI